jgi:hypothetical protein
MSDSSPFEITIKKRLVLNIFISILISFSLLCLILDYHLAMAKGFLDYNAFLFWAAILDPLGLLLSSLMLFLNKSWAYYMYKSFAILLMMVFAYMLNLGGSVVLPLVIFIVFLFLSLYILGRSEIRFQFSDWSKER